VLRTLQHKIQLESLEDTLAHVGIPLRGRFKAQSQKVSNLFLFMVPHTASRLEPGLWVSHLKIVWQVLASNLDGCSRTQMVPQGSSAALVMSSLATSWQFGMRTLPFLNQTLIFLRCMDSQDHVGEEQLPGPPTQQESHDQILNGSIIGILVMRMLFWDQWQ
jgi:hypothetical protein